MEKPLNKDNLELVRVFVDAVATGKVLDEATRQRALIAAKRLEEEMYLIAKSKMSDAYMVLFNAEKRDASYQGFSEGSVNKNYFSIVDCRNLRIGYMLIDENNYPVVVEDPTAYPKRMN